MASRLEIPLYPWTTPAISYKYQIELSTSPCVLPCYSYSSLTSLLTPEFAARVHLRPHRPGGLPDRQRVLGALLPRARHPARRPGEHCSARDTLCADWSLSPRCPRTRPSAPETTPSTPSSPRPGLVNTCPGPCLSTLSQLLSVRNLKFPSFPSSQIFSVVVFGCQFV